MKDCKIEIMIDDTRVSKKTKNDILAVLEFYRKSGLIEDMEVKRVYEICSTCELSHFIITGMCDFSAEHLINTCSILTDLAYTKKEMFIKIKAENSRYDFKEEYTIRGRKLYKKILLNQDLINENLTEILFID